MIVSPITSLLFSVLLKSTMSLSSTLNFAARPLTVSPLLTLYEIPETGRITSFCPTYILLFEVKSLAHRIVSGEILNF